MHFRVPGSICTVLLVAGTVIVSSSVASLLGHTSTRLQTALAQTPQPDRGSAVVRSDFRNVFSSALSVLADQRIPVGYVSGERGVIRTGSVTVDQNRMRQMTLERFRPVVDKLGRKGGRYLLQISVTSVRPTETNVRVRSLIVLRVVGSASPVGGQVLPSNMRIETEFLEKLAAKVRTSR